MAQRKWGIDLTKRKMKWIPYGINETGAEIKDISGLTVVETLNFFIEQYQIKYPYSKTDPIEKLIKLLNLKIISSEYYLTKDIIFNTQNNYRHETWFYTINFIKKIMGDYSFHFVSMTTMLSNEHKIYEQGFIKYFPFPKRSKDGKIIGSNTRLMTNLLKIVESKKSSAEINFDFEKELFEWINLSLPDDQIKFDSEILKNEYSFIDSEMGGYFFEFFKILSGDKDILKKIADLNINNSIKILSIGLPIRKIFQIYSFLSGIYDNTANYKLIKFENNSAIIQRIPVKEFCESVNIYFKSNLKNCDEITTSTTEAFIKRIITNVTIKEIKENRCAENEKDYCEYEFIWTRKKHFKLSYILTSFVLVGIFLLFYLSFLKFFPNFNLFLFTTLILGSIFILYNLFIFRYIKKLKNIIESQRIKSHEDYSVLQNINLELIKEKNTLEEKVIERTRQLEEAHHQKTSFFINFAHETRTPLTLIGNYLNKLSNQLRNKPVDKPVINNLDIILSNYEKIQKDIVNFLDMEKLLQGRMHYKHVVTIELKSIIENKIELFRENAKIKNITIDQTLVEVHIKIDPFAFDRIINNLLDNAIKYNKQNGKINISLKPENNNVILKIEDTGIGIDKKQIENIFKPFHQISHEKSNIQGMGVGLSIVHHIINQVEGEIQVESNKNKGTTFTITFKKSDKKSSKEVIGFSNIPTARKIELLPEKGFNKNLPVILIVEDNLELLSYLQSELHEIFNIYIAENGLKALEKIKSIPKPDLIISDIMMDEMNGYQFCRRIRKNKKFNNIPFIFLTAKTTDEDIKWGYIKGADDYITKPFNISELFLKIEKILERKAKVIKGLRQNKIESIRNKYKEFKITAQERKIIRLVKQGLENKEIADKLGISEHTAITHVKNIFFKTNAKTRTELSRMF